MTYCTPSDVRLIIDTDLTDDEIEKIIATSGAYIDRLLGAQSTSDQLINRLSVLLTARFIKTRQPTSTAIGEYRETHDPLKVWNAEIQEITTEYRRSFRMV